MFMCTWIIDYIFLLDIITIIIILILIIIIIVDLMRVHVLNEHLCS